MAFLLKGTRLRPGPTRRRSCCPASCPRTSWRPRVREPDLLEGLAWGEPREGHPEGSVAAHVADLLATLDGWGEPPERAHEAALHRPRARRRSRTRCASGCRRSAATTTPTAPAGSPSVHRRRGDPHHDQHHDRPYAIWRKLKRKETLDERALREDARRHRRPEAVHALRRARRLDRRQAPGADPLVPQRARAARLRAAATATAEG